jgi:hypothetical protein
MGESTGTIFRRHNREDLKFMRGRAYLGPETRWIKNPVRINLVGDSIPSTAMPYSSGFQEVLERSLRFLAY